MAMYDDFGQSEMKMVGGIKVWTPNTRIPYKKFNSKKKIPFKKNNSFFDKLKEKIYNFFH